MLPKILRPIAIIGAGGIVKEAHLPAYKKAGFEVKAIFDRDLSKAKELAEAFNIPKVCANIEELIEQAEKHQCIYDIALPASAFLSVLSSLPKGAPVLLQKPMGEDITQAKAILALCQERNLLAGVNFQLRHAPYIVKAKQLIAQGLIGQLHDVDVRMNVFTPWELWEFLFGLPRMEILYHSIHYIDMIRYFLGNPQRVLAKTTKPPHIKNLSSTRSSIIMDYGAEIRANINTNHGHNFGLKHQESYFKFEGTEGAIKIKIGVYLDYPKGLPDEFEYFSVKEGNCWQKVKINGTWFPDAFIGPMAGLMCKLENREYTFINSVEDAFHTMELVEECYLSSGL